MKRILKTLAKKPALISTITFVLLAVVVASVAFAGRTPVTEDESSPVLEQKTMREGYGLYIDGKLVAATTIEAVIQDTLDYVLEARLNEFSGDTVTSGSFTNTITTVYGEYEESAFVTSASLAALLGIENESSYTVSVKNYNGTECGVKLNLRVTTESKVTNVLKSDIVYVDNGNLLATHEDVVVVEGQDGITEDIFEAVYVNGECISKKYLSSTVVVEAVDRVIERGVLDNERFTANSGDTSVDDSPFIMPYDGGYISSYYGWRSMGWHSGIDIVGGVGIPCYGDPFWAARDGVVTFTGNSGTYGLVIIIQHEDGSETRYAHCSTIKVKVGEVVEQGQIIGNIGDTGFVTGPHLHFEIRIDGKTVNPLEYVRLYK